MSVIGADDFRVALASVVDKFGEEYQYNNTGNPDASCYYVARTRDDLDALGDRCMVEDDNRTKSGCIIGEAISVIAPNVDRSDLYGGILDASSVIARYYGIEFTDVAKDGMMAAQRCQDQGGTWGESLAAFDGAVSGSDYPSYLD